jgi:SAM-dependent methyltransferase
MMHQHLFDGYANCTHRKVAAFADRRAAIEKKILTRGDLPRASVAAQLDILHQLTTFPLGRFLIERGGANGFWTDYMVTGGGTDQKVPILDYLSPLERFILTKCPILVAHRERFKIFQTLLQEQIQEERVLLSIPCGMMRDLLTLDFSSVEKCTLVGIDLDPDSLALARQLAKDRYRESVYLLQQHAWDIDFQSEIDVITSSGLNVYADKRKKVVLLYQKFWEALKPGGLLITSVLTYPPGERQPTDWDLEKIAEEDLLLDKILHKYVLDIQWRNFRMLSEIQEDFLQAGFSDISVYCDTCRVFPTVVAKKNL